MLTSSARPVAAIEDDLRSCAVVRLSAQRELAEIRRRQAELAELESTLVGVVAARRLIADRLLDERLRAVGGVAAVPVAGGS
jgi:hypothetical protein